MEKIFIIAEAGVNHNGSLELAGQLVKKAAEAGADAVKFQTFSADELVCKSAQKAEYQKMDKADESQYEMLKKLELTPEMHKELIQRCKENHIVFLSTPFDLKSIRLLEQLSLPVIKIPSGEITNYPYLKRIGRMGRKVILSTGMSEVNEIEQALRVLRESGCGEISILHCTSEYPAPFASLNLRVIPALAERFSLPVGYSDHTRGIEASIAAAALGARIIEKHFTLDRNLPGPDHKASLEPEELKAMVLAIRNIEQALGDGIKQISEGEKQNALVVRKSIVAKTEIKEGCLFTEENLTTKRPGTGISPMKWKEMIGRAAKRDYRPDEEIE